MTDLSRAPAQPTFLVTKEYRRFAEFCDAVRKYRYIGLCYGPAGVGKTLSARHYAQWDLLEPVLDPTPAAASQEAPPEIIDARCVLYTPSVTATPQQVGREVDRLSYGLTWAVEKAVHPDDPNVFAPWRATWTELVLVDEADRLKLAALETLRDRYDHHRFGLVLIGMPGLEKRLGRYAQFFSRVGFVHEFRTLGEEELHFVLACQWQRLGLMLDLHDPTDTEAVAAIVRITGGNFRLVERLVSQVERIMAINGLKTVTKAAVEAARESLVIGPL